MSPRQKLALWFAAACAAALTLAIVLALALGLGHAEEDQAVLLRLLGERAGALAFCALLLLIVLGAAVAWLFRRYVTAPAALAEQVRMVLANPGSRVGSGAAAAGELSVLADGVNRLAQAREELQHDLEARAREAGARLEEERNRLAALMAELSEGVLVCNIEGRILLYNEQARALFASDGAAPRAALVGLGRSLFGLVDREQFAHVLEKLQRLLKPGEAPPTTRFVAATAAGRLLRARAALFVGSDGAIGGIVLALEDVTALLDQEARHRELLLALAAGIRAPAANIRAAAENLAAFADMGADRRKAFVGIVADESAKLSQALGDALHRHADALKASISLEDVRAVDLLEVACQRISALVHVEAAVESADESLWLRADSFALVQALLFLAARLRQDYGVRGLRLSARRAGAFGEIDLAWIGAIVATEALSLWESEPMQVAVSPSSLTLRDVLERHGAEIWMQRTGPAGGRDFRFRLQVPAGEPVQVLSRAGAASGESRPEYYDFDLFRERGVPAELQARRLSELAYTVFDTETTGLEPSAGDEIISIGAVRIVNGRLLKSEVFEQLVDPRRALDRESARIHGISAEALAGQSRIDEVLPLFHRFCEDTVLVAHNAAFDMRFLELKEASSGVRFAQPVLDTLLLSAALQPSQEDHRLESIAERLGVRVIGRHTALGDALLTGEIFLKLLALLADQGVTTLGQALEASRQTYYARLQY